MTSNIALKVIWHHRVVFEFLFFPVKGKQPLKPLYMQHGCKGAAKVNAWIKTLVHHSKFICLYAIARIYWR
jgi:hypothetical protein